MGLVLLAALGGLFGFLIFRFIGAVLGFLWAILFQAPEWLTLVFVLGCTGLVLTYQLS